VKKVNQTKLDDQRRSFNKSNEEFRCRTTFHETVYRHLEQFEVDIERSTLISWFDEEEGSVVLDVIRQDGVVFRFYSERNPEDQKPPEDISDRFMDEVRRNTQKPWATATIAWNTFTKGHASEQLNR